LATEIGGYRIIIPKPPTKRKGGFYMNNQIDGSITITPGKDLSDMTLEGITNGLKGIQSALEQGLPPGMKEVIAAKPKLQIPKMATGTVVPKDVHFLELKQREEEAKEVREEARHRELIDAILDKKQAEAEAQHISVLEPEDPTDTRIMLLLKKDTTLTDSQIAQNIGVSRQAVNTRRRALQKAGYKVR
jgi:hypothetical protein